MSDIEYCDINLITEPEDKIHKDAPLHVEKIKGSMDQFGNLIPLIVDAELRIVDGVSRFRAEIRRGASNIPIRRLIGATPAQAKAIRIALNKIQKEAKFDDTVFNNNILELIGSCPASAFLAAAFTACVRSCKGST